MRRDILVRNADDEIWRDLRTFCVKTKKDYADYLNIWIEEKLIEEGYYGGNIKKRGRDK